MKTAPLFALAALALSTQSWADARIQGQLQDATGHQVAGAQILLKDSPYRAVTGKDGRFQLPAVAQGRYQLLVQYMGASPLVKSIEVVDGRPLELPLVLDGAVERITVVGQAASLSRSLNRQKTADNILSVAAADAIGQYPDDNASESLQRLPGISIERDQGEGRFVRIRGLAPDLNTVTYGGVALPAPEAGRRAVALDVIPSDLLSSLEVAKSLTPDMDANSLGGNVEMKSYSAFDRDSRYFSFSAEASHNRLEDKTSPKLAASYSDTFDLGDQVEVLGLALAGSWYERKFGSDNVETGGAWDGDQLEETELRDYSITRERTGLAANLDYRPSEQQQFYLRGLYSEFSDDESRQALGAEFEEPLAPGQAGSAELSRELKARKETQTIQALILGGQSLLDDWTFKYQAAVSRAEEDTPFYISGAAFESELDGLSYQGRQKPVLTGPAALYDAGAFALGKVKMADTDTTDRDNSLKLDVIHHWDLAQLTLDLQGGAKFSRREKRAYEDAWSFKDIADNATLADFSAGQADYGLGTFGPRIDRAAIARLVGSLDRADYLEQVDSAINDYAIDEDTDAGYLMATANWQKLRLVAGLRYERSKRQARGFSALESDDDAISPVTANRSEDQWLPSLNLRYSFSDQTQLRAALSSSFVRPTFEQLAPGMYREGDQGEYEAEFGNPQLKSMTSRNYDLSLEHYMGEVGVISAGLFYKDIKHFIYSADLAGRSGYEDFDQAKTFINGDDADLYGLELNYVKRFDTLPAPYNNLLLSVNGTWTDSKATINWLEDGGLQSRELPFPSQSDKTANFAIGYEDDRISLRLSAAYQSQYLLEVSELDDANYDLYTDSHLQWDFIAKWFATPRLQLSFKALNLNDEPYYVYTGRQSLNAQYEEYGRTFQLGLQYNTF